jgi:hypothetical protein
MLRISVLKASFVAALLLPFCAAAAEATTIGTTTISCGFGNNNPSPCTAVDSKTDNIYFFDNGAYSLELHFVGTIPNGTGFNVAVTDSELTDPTPSGYECLNLTGTPDGCRQFAITPDSDAQWTGGVEVTIAWLRDTSSIYPNGTTDLVRMFHFHGTDVTDVTVLGSYFDVPAGCGTHNGHPRHPDPNPGTGCDDPGVTGFEDSFSDNAVFHQILSAETTAAAVPEPATLVLFGSGLMALAAVRRRAAKR